MKPSAVLVSSSAGIHIRRNFAARIVTHIVIVGAVVVAIIVVDVGVTAAATIDAGAINEISPQKVLFSFQRQQGAECHHRTPSI